MSSTYALHSPGPLGVPADDVTILLVEDDDGDALLVREWLSDALPGVTLLRTSDLASALTLVPQAHCALLDLGLPDTAGTEGVARLVAAAESLAVVVLTGAEHEATGVAALAAGAQDYLVKGRVDGDSLARSVRYALARKRAAEAARQLLDAERRRIENARVERGLVPTPLIRSSDTTLTVRYRAARDGAELGGDFYDAVELDDGSLHLVIGDVSGHGPDEAALGARLRSAWRALVLAGLSTERVLSVLERVLCSEREDLSDFATLAHVCVGPRRDAAEVHLAGHPPPFVLGPQGAIVPDVRFAPLLGVVPGARWPGTTVPLGPRWGLLLFTDGLVEGRAGQDHPARLGQAAVTGILDRLLARGLDADQLLDTLLAEVERANGEPLADDVALCLVEGTARG